jgi:hypothetical protein
MSKRNHRWSLILNVIDQTANLINLIIPREYLSSLQWATDKTCFYVQFPQKSKIPKARLTKISLLEFFRTIASQFLSAEFRLNKAAAAVGTPSMNTRASYA